MTGNFRPLDRDTLLLLPPSLQDWLPENHLARFVVEVVSKLDLSAIRTTYAGHGKAAYQPELLVALLFYGYATGVFSSRKLERATYDSVAFRYLAADQHPEHDTISDFRKRFLPQLQSLFEQILILAAESGFIRVGRVSIDGTKVHADASRHSAMSYAHAQKLAQQIKDEVRELMRLAEEADTSPVPDGLDIPAELQRREDRLQAIDSALERIREREQERINVEQRTYEAKMEARREQEERTGKKIAGKVPQHPSGEIDPKAQINFTDPESRIMPVPGGGFEQAYNAQIGVDCDARLIVSNDVSQKPNDQLQLTGSLEQLLALPPALGKVEEVLADAGYFSAANVAACAQQGVTPYISDAREPHYPGLGRFFEPAELNADATDVERARHRLRTVEGRAVYALRKSTVEPVIGIIKAAIGFRQFSLRTLEKVRGEWCLVSIAYNLKRMFNLKCAGNITIAGIVPA
jgi:transposase